MVFVFLGKAGFLHTSQTRVSKNLKNKKARFRSRTGKKVLISNRQQGFVLEPPKKELIRNRQKRFQARTSKKVPLSNRQKRFVLEPAKRFRSSHIIGGYSSFPSRQIVRRLPVSRTRPAVGVGNDDTGRGLHDIAVPYRRRRVSIAVRGGGFQRFNGAFQSPRRRGDSTRGLPLGGLLPSYCIPGTYLPRGVDFFLSVFV